MGELLFGDRPTGCDLSLGRDNFYEAQKRLTEKLKNDSDVGARVLAAMMEPDRARQMVQYEFAGELADILHEKIIEGYELRHFCRQLASWMVTNSGYDEEWGLRSSPVNVSVKLSLIENLQSSVKATNGST